MSRNPSPAGKGAKRSIYLSQQVADTLALSDTDSFSPRVAHLITLADALVMPEVPALALSEWMALASALNGHYPAYEQGPRAVFGSAWHSVYDSAPEADAQFGVDCKSLAHRMQAMPLAAQAGAFEVVKRFWSRVVDDPQDNEAALRAVGAKIA